jgi:hypothetical protein
MRLYNFETVLFDDRDFRPAELEPRNAYGIPIVTENTRVLETRRDDGSERFILAATFHPGVAIAA